MVHVTLTTFIDFVSKAGTPKATCVRQAIKQYGQEYHPNFDHWKILRDAIIDLHKNNRSKSSLDSIFNGLNEKQKTFSDISQFRNDFK